MILFIKTLLFGQLWACSPGPWKACDFDLRETLEKTVIVKNELPASAGYFKKTPITLMFINKQHITDEEFWTLSLVPRGPLPFFELFPLSDFRNDIVKMEAPSMYKIGKELYVPFLRYQKDQNSRCTYDEASEDNWLCGVSRDSCGSQYNKNEVRFYQGHDGLDSVRKKVKVTGKRHSTSTDKTYLAYDEDVFTIEYHTEVAPNPNYMRHSCADGFKVESCGHNCSYFESEFGDPSSDDFLFKSYEVSLKVGKKARSATLNLETFYVHPEIEKKKIPDSLTDKEMKDLILKTFSNADPGILKTQKGLNFYMNLFESDSRNMMKGWTLKSARIQL